MKGRRSIPAVDPSATELGDVLDDLRDRIADLERADQTAFRSLDEGALEIYDDDDNLRGRIGKQPDGGFSAKAFGKKPATPTEPDVLPAPGGCVVEWDGTFEEAQTDDVQRIAIHVGSSADFAIVTGDEDVDSDSDATERAAIVSPRGGSAFLSVDPGEGKVWVRLTAIAEGGVESDPSTSVEVDIAAPEAAFHQDTFILSKAGAQELTLTYQPIDNSEHLYWCGIYQREDVTWTRRRKTVALSGLPFPPRIGDSVTVEYAYLLGEQPEEITYYRGTPLAAWNDSFESLGTTYNDQIWLRFLEPVGERVEDLDYTSGGNNHDWSLFARYYLFIDDEWIVGAQTYTQVGVPRTSWIDDNHTYTATKLYHTLEIPGDAHPHPYVACHVYRYDWQDAYGTDAPEPGDNNPQDGTFWLGPQIAGKPRPWRPYGEGA